MKVLTVRSKKLFFTVCAIVYCLKSIGLAPFSIPIEKPAQMNCHSSVQAFFISKAGQAYNILLLILVIVVPTFHPPSFISTSHSNGLSIDNILSVIATTENIVFIFTSCLILISWAFRQKRAAYVMNKLLEVDVRLSSLKKQPFSKRALIFLTLHMISNACLWIYYWVAIIVYQDIDNLTTEFFARVPDYIIYWFIMEYVTVVGLVARDLETVNQYLLNFEQFASNLSRPLVRNGIPVVSSASSCSSSRVARLKVLRSVRTTLCELCDDIADFFSFPILLCIGSCFIPIFEQLSKMLRTADDRAPEVIRDLIWFDWILVFILRYIYPVVSLTLNVTRTKREARRTGQIIHKLLAAARTKEFKAELEQFSLQLLHEKVNFTACGLFPLDSTLLQSMLAGVAGYTVILIQFGSSVCNCNCNCHWNGTSAQ